MIVMKFGGTSVGSAAMIRRVIEIVTSRQEPIVVVSAVSKVTDLLIQAARAAEKGKHASCLNEISEIHASILKELGLPQSLLAEQMGLLERLLDNIADSGRLTSMQLDEVCSFGERLSVIIVAASGSAIGMRAYNAYDLGLATDDNFGSAEVLPEAYGRLKIAFTSIPQGTIPVVTGFLGRTTDGRITTLGRGGSDYSASLIGAAMDSEAVEIWTDVNGIMSADPRIAPEARTIPKVTFEEASELAYLGAKVLHPKTILPVIRKGIPVIVLNTYEPAAAGTQIVRDAERKDGITAIVSKKGLSIVNVNSERMFLMHGFLHKIFNVFDEHRISVDMVSTSEVNVSVTVDSRFDSGMGEAVRKLGEFSRVSLEDGKASISVVGHGIKRNPDTTARIFATLSATGINPEMISQGASEINIGLVVEASDADKAVRVLHAEFFGGAK